MALPSHYVIVLVKDLLTYRVSDNLMDVFDRLRYDDDLPDVIPLGFCSSANWLMEWQVEDELRDKVSGSVLQLINHIRRTHHP